MHIVNNYIKLFHLCQCDYLCNFVKFAKLFRFVKNRGREHSFDFITQKQKKEGSCLPFSLAVSLLIQPLIVIP